MKLNPPRSRHARGRAAFTLAEVLAALLFMAIVIPVAVQGLRVASLAGTLGQRKTIAAQIGERVLNELKATGQLKNNAQSGSTQQGGLDYRWTLRSEAWSENPLQLVTLQVSFPAQGRNYDISLSTLVNNSQ
ncbi:MAG: type II secretion system protein GspI [Verrucomicrobiota bacterium]